MLYLDICTYRSNPSWYTGGREVQCTDNQNSVTHFSDPFLLYTQDEMSLLVTSPPPMDFTAANTIIVTDGLCGSTCAQFTKTAASTEYARVAYLGGNPIQWSDIASYTGGYVTTLADLANIISACIRSGFRIPPGVQGISRLPTTALMSINMAESLVISSAYSDPPTEPLQYQRFQADFNLYVWGPTSSPDVQVALNSIYLQMLVDADQRPGDGRADDATSDGSFHSEGTAQGPRLLRKKPSTMPP
jgi:hypothetical protein